MAGQKNRRASRIPEQPVKIPNQGHKVKLPRSTGIGLVM